jgi:hypothetical protein
MGIAERRFVRSSGVCSGFTMRDQSVEIEAPLVRERGNGL